MSSGLWTLPAVALTALQCRQEVMDRCRQWHLLLTQLLWQTAFRVNCLELLRRRTLYASRPLQLLSALSHQVTLQSVLPIVCYLPVISVVFKTRMIGCLNMHNCNVLLQERRRKGAVKFTFQFMSCVMSYGHYAVQRVLPAPGTGEFSWRQVFTACVPLHSDFKTMLEFSTLVYTPVSP